MPATTFPTDSVHVLLDMVRGVRPFSLAAALRYTLAIANYIDAMFERDSALPMSWTRELSLEEALASADSGPGFAAKSINLSILQAIVKMLLAWLVEKNTGPS